MGNSFFHFKSFSIITQEKGLKVNTDACLLGAWATHVNPRKILDIGSGTGVISLMLAQRFPEARVCSVEIVKEVFQEAKINIENSPFRDQIEILHQDILTFKTSDTFHLIVCNPPYFSNHLEKSNPIKNSAIHNHLLPPKDLIESVIPLMDAHSVFYVLYPPFEFEQFTQMAQIKGLYLQQRIEVYNKPGKHYRSLGGYGIEKKENCFCQTFDLQNESGGLSDEFRLLMQPFYLENSEKYKRKNK